MHKNLTKFIVFKVFINIMIVLFNFNFTSYLKMIGSGRVLSKNYIWKCNKHLLCESEADQSLSILK